LNPFPTTDYSIILFKIENHHGLGCGGFFYGLLVVLLRRAKCSMFNGQFSIKNENSFCASYLKKNADNY